LPSSLTKMKMRGERLAYLSRYLWLKQTELAGSSYTVPVFNVLAIADLMKMKSAFLRNSYVIVPVNDTGPVKTFLKLTSSPTVQ